MRLFLVESHLPGMEEDDLRTIQRAVVMACGRFTSQGENVRYVQGIYVPGQGRYLCLFEALDDVIVRKVNQVAQLPFQRIQSVVTLEA